MDSTWKPSTEYQKVAKANALTYAKNAERYDATETCIVAPRYQAMLNRDIDEIIRILGSNDNRSICALDACGGSGNMGLKLLDRGIQVTLCDISPELIDIYKSKCKERGFLADVQCDEIGSFLSSTDKKFDLIVFSSALEHLYDYTSILRLAISRLNPSGLIYTVFDPTKRSFLDILILTADLLAFELLNHPTELPSGLYRKFKRVKSGNIWDRGSKEGLELTQENVGVLAEYHALSGIDDFALVESMKRDGLDIVQHTRYADAIYGFFRLILSLLRRPTSFKLLLRRRG